MILQLDKEELILQNHAWIEALADAVGELVPDVHVENIKAGVYTGIVQVLNLHPKELSLSALTQFFEERISALLLEIMRKPDDERMRAYETIYKIFRRVLQRHANPITPQKCMQISLESAWNIIIHLKKELHIISPVAQLPQIVESKAGTSNSSLTRFQVDLHPLDGAFLEGQSAAGGRSMRAIALDAISLYDTLVKGIKPDGSVDIVVVNGKGEHFPRTLYLRGF